MYVVADYGSWFPTIDLCTGLITAEEAYKVVREIGIQSIMSYLSTVMRSNSQQERRDLAEQVYQTARDKNGQLYDYHKGMVAGVKADSTFCQIFVFDGNHTYERVICACKIPEPVCEVL